MQMIMADFNIVTHLIPTFDLVIDIQADWLCCLLRDMTNASHYTKSTTYEPGQGSM